MSDARNELAVALALSYLIEVLDLREHEEALKDELNRLLREGHSMLRCSGCELEDENRKEILNYFTSWCVVDAQPEAMKRGQKLSLSKLLSAPSSSADNPEHLTKVIDTTRAISWRKR